MGASGVVAYSSGNHAQGVAAASSIYNIQSHVLMPSDAPRIKIENTERYGAKVVLYTKGVDDRDLLASQLASTHNLAFIHPYDDPMVIAGQGTVGLEIVEQVAAQNASIDQVIVPCGGGGLSSGVALALSELLPSAAVLVVEPLSMNDTLRSLKSGHRVENEKGATTICDSLLSSPPGKLTFPLLQRFLSGSLAVSDHDVLKALHYSFFDLKQVVEPGGVVGLAAVLRFPEYFSDKTSVIVLSGGNLDASQYGAYINSEATGDLTDCEARDYESVWFKRTSDIKSVRFV